MDNHRRSFIKKVTISAGQVLLKHYKLSQREIVKGKKDITLSADLESEKLLISSINKKYPEELIMSEESNPSAVGKNTDWIIDPLDGTMNFRYKIPYFAVSLAYMIDGEVFFSTVFNPMTNELFWAEKGLGAYLNDKQISVSSEDKLERFFVTYSTSHHCDRKAIRSGIGLIGNILKNCRAFRLKGASLLDFCELARGNFDALVKVKANYWDYAAGSLIAMEAGAGNTNLTIKNINLTNIITTNNKIHEYFCKKVCGSLFE